MVKKRITKKEFSDKRKRKLIAYQESHSGQVFRRELQELVTYNELIYIINKIRDISMKEHVRYPEYDQFKDMPVDIGRLRLGDFRIFVHRLDNENWLMLSIYRKTTKKTPNIETNKALSRLKKYLERDN